MAKKEWKSEKAQEAAKEDAQPVQVEAPAAPASTGMSLAEARAYRASLYKPAKKELSDEEKRDSFKMFWARSKRSYGNPKNLEQVLWLHLKATGNDEPEKFESGISHFGLKRIG